MAEPRYRVGRKLGRTILDTHQTDPVTDDHLLVGTMDTRELAAAAVAGLNVAGVTREQIRAALLDAYDATEKSPHNRLDMMADGIMALLNPGS